MLWYSYTCIITLPYFCVVTSHVVESLEFSDILKDECGIVDNAVIIYHGYIMLK